MYHRIDTIIGGALTKGSNYTEMRNLNSPSIACRGIEIPKPMCL